MIDRQIITKRVDGRELQITIDDHSASGGGYVVSSADLNHAIHLLNDHEWLVRDAADVNGLLAIVALPGTIRPLTDDEKEAWKHDRSPIVFKSPPVPAFKVGNEDGAEVPFGEVRENDEASPVEEQDGLEHIPQKQGEETLPAPNVGTAGARQGKDTAEEIHHD